MQRAIDKTFNQAILWLVLFTIPLLFVNIRSDHDWGGDFAQYLKQAENIANGIPYTQSKYVFNKNVDKYISLNPDGNTLVFENRNFKLYKIKEY